MRRARTFGSTIAACLLLSTTHARSETFNINFDELLVSEGATLGNQYLATTGLTFAPGGFTGPGYTPGEIWATNTDMTLTAIDIGSYGPPPNNAPSGRILRALGAPGGIYPTRGWRNEDGDPVMTLSFASPISTFAADFRGVSIVSFQALGNRLFAYDASNNQIAFAQATPTGLVNTQRLTLNSSTPIAKIILTPGSFGDWVGIDNIEFTTGPVESLWNVDAGGLWSALGNWSAGVPNSTSAAARLGTRITAPRTVLLDTPVTLDKLTLDGTFNYTVQGTSALTLSGNTTLAIVAGGQSTHVIGSPLAFNKSATVQVEANTTLSTTRLTSLAGTTLTKTGQGTWRLTDPRMKGLQINQGKITLDDASTTAGLATQLVIGASGVLDVRSSGFVVDFDPKASSPLAAITLAIAQGRVRSSAANSQQAVGIGDAATLLISSFLSVPISDTSAVVLRLTLKGDSDLNGVVNFNDLVSLARAYNQSSNQKWTDGDSNYDGAVNFNDLVELARNYNQSLASDETVHAANLDPAQFALDWQRALALVPEPSILLLSSALLTGLLVRRSRK